MGVLVALFSMESQSDFLRILPSTNSMLVNAMKSTVGGFLGPTSTTNPAFDNKSPRWEEDEERISKKESYLIFIL